MAEAPSKWIGWRTLELPLPPTETPPVGGKAVSDIVGSGSSQAFGPKNRNFFRSVPIQILRLGEPYTRRDCFPAQKEVGKPGPPPRTRWLSFPGGSGLLSVRLTERQACGASGVRSVRLPLPVTRRTRGPIQADASGQHRPARASTAPADRARPGTGQAMRRPPTFGGLLPAVRTPSLEPRRGRREATSGEFPRSELRCRPLPASAAA